MQENRAKTLKGDKSYFFFMSILIIGRSGSGKENYADKQIISLEAVVGIL
jgi:hypothetical protein